MQAQQQKSNRRRSRNDRPTTARGNHDANQRRLLILSMNRQYHHARLRLLLICLLPLLLLLYLLRPSSFHSLSSKSLSIHSHSHIQTFETVAQASVARFTDEIKRRRVNEQPIDIDRIISDDGDDEFIFVDQRIASTQIGAHHDDRRSKFAKL